MVTTKISSTDKLHKIRKESSKRVQIMEPLNKDKLFNLKEEEHLIMMMVNKLAI